MKVGIYVNKEKDIEHIWLNELKKLLNAQKIEYFEMDGKGKDNPSADALFVIGGDGTILGLTDYALSSGTPLIGINAGKLGFLTEFETFEMADAVKNFALGKLKREARAAICASINGQTFYALNDIVVQRIYTGNEAGLIINVGVSVDGNLVDKIAGDGVIISTPTGSTAYSLSAGGSILSPGINVFSVTPISAHSLHHRPIIYSADSICDLELLGNCSAGLFVDGELKCALNEGDMIKVEKCEHTVDFLRKMNSNFYKRLLMKLNVVR